MRGIDFLWKLCYYYINSCEYRFLGVILGWTMSFRIKLISIFLLASVILGALIGMLTYSHSKRIVVENKKKEMADTVNRIDININVRVRYIMDAAENAAASHVVQNLFFK